MIETTTTHCSHATRPPTESHREQWNCPGWSRPIRSSVWSGQQLRQQTINLSASISTIVHRSTCDDLSSRPLVIPCFSALPRTTCRRTDHWPLTSHALGDESIFGRPTLARRRHLHLDVKRDSEMSTMTWPGMRTVNESTSVHYFWLTGCIWGAVPACIVRDWRLALIDYKCIN